MTNPPDRESVGQVTQILNRFTIWKKERMHLLKK